MYKVVFTRSAYNNFKKLDKRYQKAVALAIDKLAENPHIGNPLKGKLKGFWKLRFSRYRIIYQIKSAKMIVIIFEVVHRRKAYK